MHHDAPQLLALEDMLGDAMCTLMLTLEAAQWLTTHSSNIVSTHVAPTIVNLLND